MAEAVRIIRRGGEGAVLNSRAEHKWSHIPQLQVEKRDEEQIIELWSVNNSGLGSYPQLTEQKGLGLVDYAISEYEDGTEVANSTTTLEVMCRVKGYETGNPPMHSDMNVTACRAI